MENQTKTERLRLNIRWMDILLTTRCKSKTWLSSGRIHSEVLLQPNFRFSLQTVENPQRLRILQNSRDVFGHVFLTHSRFMSSIHSGFHFCESSWLVSAFQLFCSRFFMISDMWHRSAVLLDPSQTRFQYFYTFNIFEPVFCCFNFSLL